MIYRLLGALFASLFTGGLALATEEPKHVVILEEGEFQIRDYPALIAAEVSVSGSRDEASSAGFKLLAGYIFGENSRQLEIAMTAPVMQEREEGETIAMTAPVTQSGGPDGWIVRFIMPDSYTMETLPRPKDDRVRLVRVPPQRFAVVRFSGLARPDEVELKAGDLEVFMARQDIEVGGDASLARYDPPWTPWFLRRNEVWIAVAPSE